MNSVLVRSSIVATFAFSLVACSSSSGGDRTADKPGITADACDPKGTIPCFKGLAEPCKGLNSGFDGDEYCLAPPDPALGFQIHVGPSDYSDTAQTDKYMIAPGDETNWSETVVTPNDQTVFTRGYHSHMRPGSHHFIMFAVKDAGPGGVQMNASGAESAVGAVGGTFLGGATRAVQNIDTRGEYPEDQGIGSEMPPLKPVAMNLHFINIGDKPLLQELWVNFILIDEAEVTKYVKPITWYGGLGMAIPNGQHTTLKSTPGSCKAPADVRIGMMTGHVHASTLRITTTMNDSNVLFEEFDWHEPSEWRFNRAAQNVAPDAVTQRSGGFSGVVNATPSDQFAWECEIENQSGVTLNFSNHVYTGEMCNVFGFYFTDNQNATPWLCAFN